MRRIFSVASGEGPLVAALGALMLATAAGGALGATASEALLFANFDLAQLPLRYVALGVTTFACTLLASAFARGWGARAALRDPAAGARGGRRARAPAGRDRLRVA